MNLGKHFCGTGAQTIYYHTPSSPDRLVTSKARKLTTRLSFPQYENPYNKAGLESMKHSTQRLSTDIDFRTILLAPVIGIRIANSR